jgi:ABC-type glycerol-3-phosphate transport system permease component
MVPGMVTGQGRLEQAVRVWLPVGFFLLLALFPFYWMAVTSVKPNAELYNKNLMPLLVHNPTLKHYIDLLTETSFLVWTWTRCSLRSYRRRSRSSWGRCWLIRWHGCASRAPG